MLFKLASKLTKPDSRMIKQRCRFLMRHATLLTVAASVCLLSVSPVYAVTTSHASTGGHVSTTHTTTATHTTTPASHPMTTSPAARTTSPTMSTRTATPSVSATRSNTGTTARPSSSQVAKSVSANRTPSESRVIQSASRTSTYKSLSSTHDQISYLNWYGAYSQAYRNPINYFTNIAFFWMPGNIWHTAMTNQTQDTMSQAMINQARTRHDRWITVGHTKVAVPQNIYDKIQVGDSVKLIDGHHIQINGHVYKQ